MRSIFLFLFVFFPILCFAQHQDKVDFIHGEAFLSIIPKQKKLIGTVVYQFEVLKDVDSIFLDAKKMKFESIYIDVDSMQYKNDGGKVIILKKFKKGQIHLLEMNYSCTPKQTLYFSGWDDDIIDNDQIWTQGQGKYTSHWLPSFDAMEEKIEFDLNFEIQKNNLSIIANGMGHLPKFAEHLGKMMFRFDMQKPMSSYLLAFAIGNYNKQELKSKSGIPIENYYYPQDSLKVEPTYRYTKEIFDYLEEEIGFPYPWQNYKQIPVRDFLYAGMENTTATIFSDQYVIDSTAFVDKNYVNVNAHELAHQWFGNLVTEKNGNHHWLHEGFATYYAQLAEKEVFGDDHYYWKLFNTAKQLQNLSADGVGQALVDPKASSATFYEKGAWALVMLKESIGEEAFKKGITAYLNKYQFKNVTIRDFLNEMEMVSGQSLASFKQKWLESTEFQFEDIKTFLMTKNSSIRMFYVSKHLGTNSLSWLKEEEPIQYKEALLDEFREELSEIDLFFLLKSRDFKIRQKAIQILDEVPDLPGFSEEIKQDIEKLLYDKSYVTIENALFKLWVSYPQEKAKYLEKTKDIIGLPNKNVRLLWLTLAILTNDYDGRNTQVYFKELNKYTSNEYGWEIRMGAFQYLNQALGLNEESLRNLVDATNHHSWQFKKFARNLVIELIKDEDYRFRFEALSNELNEEQTRYLKTQLSKE